MRRRDLLTLSTLAFGGISRAQSPDTRPNFVFLMADDMGMYELGCYGQKHILTPNMDKLATEGMRFTDCYAGASVCAPSRSVLMTGQHTGHTRIRANMSFLNGGRVPLRAEDHTVASMLKGPEWRGAFDETRAYATGIFGKWGLGEPGTTGLPNDHGFDEFYGFLNQQHAHSHYVQYLWRNKTREPLKGNRNGQKREYASDLMAREALHFIDRHRYEPFFLYFTPTVPHAAFEAPELGPYADKPWPEEAKHYAAMVTRFDRYVGQIMAKLKECGLDENTLVFVTSDNGGAVSGFDEFRSMGPYRDKKGSPYEGGLRVPMLARWPGKVQAGSVSDMPWSFQDVFPTLADLAELRGIPPNVDGISIAPTLLGKAKQNYDRPLYWEQFSARTIEQSVRMGRWKGIRSGLGGKLAVYDLQADPGESKDVAGQNPEVVRKMT
ncbi:MAG: arylsulfatase, partial [Bryobacterales bacterium]|nr:arylsulfatase [Bryobacterales bacterium]